MSFIWRYRKHWKQIIPANKTTPHKAFASDVLGVLCAAITVLSDCNNNM